MDKTVGIAGRELGKGGLWVLYPNPNGGTSFISLGDDRKLYDRIGDFGHHEITVSSVLPAYDSAFVVHRFLLTANPGVVVPRIL